MEDVVLFFVGFRERQQPKKINKMERFRVCAASLLPCALYVWCHSWPNAFYANAQKDFGHVTTLCCALPLLCCCSVVSFWPVFCFPSNMQTSADRRNCFVRTHTLRQDFNTRLICIRLYSTVLMGLMVFFPYSLIKKNIHAWSCLFEFSMKRLLVLILKISQQQNNRQIMSKWET